MRIAMHMLLTAAVTAELLSGCSSSNIFTSPAELVKDPGRLIGHPRYDDSVARVVAIWEPATGKGIDDRNTRGFAGQILFFGPACETGARVRGKVKILEFDHYDVNADEPPEPLHTFSFDAEAWEVHRTEGTLGHSYSVFIPYMSRNKDQVNCALKVELILEKDGRRITSPEVEVLLPGRNTTEQAALRTRGFVRQRQIGGSQDSEETHSHGTERKLETLTIPLPR